MGKLDQLLKQFGVTAGADEAIGSLLQQASHMMLEHAGHAAIITDALGRIEYLNPVAEEYLGWTRAETQGLPVSKIVRLMNQATGLPMANAIRKVLVQGRMMVIPS